jgi:hypothetical protein
VKGGKEEMKKNKGRSNEYKERTEGGMKGTNKKQSETGRGKISR